MTDNIKERVKGVLDNYLAVCNHRKTPERYAILDAVYSLQGHFSVEQLGALLEARNFRVSRATLYNTIRLFLELRLVIRHRLTDGTKYEACYCNGNHVHQICTVCGKVLEIEAPELIRVMDTMKLHRFRKDGYSLYIYGICSACQAKLTRKKSQKIKEKTKKNK